MVVSRPARDRDEATPSVGQLAGAPVEVVVERQLPHRGDRRRMHRLPAGPHQVGRVGVQIA